MGWGEALSRRPIKARPIAAFATLPTTSKTIGSPKKVSWQPREIPMRRQKKPSLPLMSDWKATGRLASARALRLCLAVGRGDVLTCVGRRVAVLARNVPRAACGVLRLACLALGYAVSLQFRISDEIAETLQQSAFELVADAEDAIGIYPSQKIPAGVVGVQGSADSPLGGSVRHELCVANDFAEALLESAFDLMADANNAIVFHEKPFFRVLVGPESRVGRSGDLETVVRSLSTLRSLERHDRRILDISETIFPR